MGTEWVAVGLSRDLPAGVAMPALWQGRELAVWRSASGKLSAWNDRCPHRGMRLSHGFVRGETLACIYHGWVYGTSGSCIHIPAHPDLVPPATIKAETFLCVEAGGVVWGGGGGSPPNPPPPPPSRPPPPPSGAGLVWGGGGGGVIWVGAAGATDTPPEFAGYVPLRSVATQADAAAFAQASGLEQAAQGLLGSTAAGGVCLILSTSQTKTTIHALAAKEADRVALSRWLDGVVRRAEERVLA